MSRADRFGTIRFRITALATVVVAAVLAIVAVALVLLVRRELFSNLDNSLEQRADTYQSALLDGDDEPLSILLNSNDEDRAAQLVDDDRTVLAATPNLARSGPLLAAGEDTSAQTIRSTTVPGLEDDAYRVLSRPLEIPAGTAVLHVAQNIDDLDDTVRALTVTLAGLVPIVVALLAGLVWWLVGRTLRPVELIRAEVAEISGTDLQRRLPVPAQADEIARLAATMNEMLDRIDNAASRQRQFVADASHELRTPLTRIRTEIEVDQSHPGLADHASTNAGVLHETIELQRLLDDLLFLAQSDEREHSAEFVPIDLDDIVLAEVSSMRAESDVRIDTSGVSAAHLSGDARQLRRVVRNLLNNAVRHTESEVIVTLAERIPSDGRDLAVELAVADDGPGVPAAHRDRIFERFGRADDARTRSGGGTGLGLAIVRDIVNRHSGTVRYDDHHPTGARFILELPINPQ